VDRQTGLTSSPSLTGEQHAEGLSSAFGVLLLAKVRAEKRAKAAEKTVGDLLASRLRLAREGYPPRTQEEATALYGALHEARRIVAEEEGK